VPEKLQDKISSILINLDKSEYGRAILKGIKPGMTAMRSAKDSDYDNLRHILDTLSKQGLEW
jgi:ABC-type phosphate/phosphonate transport system substrate-binding protein